WPVLPLSFCAFLPPWPYPNRILYNQRLKAQKRPLIPDFPHFLKAAHIRAKPPERKFYWVNPVCKISGAEKQPLLVNLSELDGQKMDLEAQFKPLRADF